MNTATDYLAQHITAATAPLEALIAELRTDIEILTNALVARGMEVERLRAVLDETHASLVFAEGQQI
jgi:septal ring factor EnvC (AmiA/AmiB activator)